MSKSAPPWNVINDWLLDHNRAAFDAIHYLMPETQYQCGLKIWHDSGEPDLSEYYD